MKLTRRQSLALLASPLCRAADDVLAQWRRIARDTDGLIGASALQIESGRQVSLHGDDRFPLASVCKLPIAMNILAMAGEGKLSLEEEIEIPLYDLFPGVSIVAERWPGQKRFRLNELLEWMVAKSDNTAVQTLFRLGGDAPGMAARLRQWQIDGIHVDRSERQCTLDALGVTAIPPVEQWTPGMVDKLAAKVPPAKRLAAFRRFLDDPRDTATPNASVRLLQRAFQGKLLPAAMTKRLREILEATTTGSARIKGLLPAGTVVAHKTGTTLSVQGLNGATNDAGVIVLPKGAGLLAIAVYVKGSRRSDGERDRVIAKISRAAFDWAIEAKGNA